MKKDNDGKQDLGYQVVIPSGTLKDLDTKDPIEGRIVQYGNYVNIEFGETMKSIVPMRFYMIPAFLVSVLLLISQIVLGRTQVPLTGDYSIASAVIIFGTLSGMACFLYFYTRSQYHKREFGPDLMFIRNLPAVFISYFIILLLLLVFAFNVLGGLFYGASFDVYTSAFFIGVMIAVINYLMISIGQSLTSSIMIRTLSIIIVAGVFIAMITNKDHMWWIENFSFLGTPEATRSWQFNLTLIVSALLMIALIDYLFVDIYAVFGKTARNRVLKGLLVAVALCLGGVGAFPYNDIPFYQSMHNRVAGYLVYLIIILIILARWIIPNVDKQFLKLSYTIGGILVVCTILFIGVGYLSLTAFELVAFLLSFSWLLLLLNSLINSVHQLQYTKKVYLTKTE